MKKMTALLATIMISLTLIMGGVSDAEARRFGGARSFGGKSAFGSPFRRSTTSKSARSANQQKAYKQNKTARQGMSRRGGFMGMLGGLALGGLLGAMFFGGAFEGFNFMDILIFAGIAYLLYRLFSAKVRGRKRPAYSSDNYGSRDQDDYLSGYTKTQHQDFSIASKQSSAGFDTDYLFNKDKKQSYSSNATDSYNDADNDADFEQDIIPLGFDEADFLAGATGAFKDLQKAWDNHDLAEIRGLTTDKVFAEIQDQLKASTENNQTDVLKVDAELLSIREVGNDLEAVVLFDTLIREEVNSQAEQIREVWHFIKSRNSLQPKWYLDGLQQLEV